MKKESPRNDKQATQYVEVTVPALSERDATALINSVRFPGKPNELMKETMRKHRARS